MSENPALLKRRKFKFTRVFYPCLPVSYNSEQEMFTKMYRELASFLKTGVVMVLLYLVA